MPHYVKWRYQYKSGQTQLELADWLATMAHPFLAAARDWWGPATARRTAAALRCAPTTASAGAGTARNSV